MININFKTNNIISFESYKYLIKHKCNKSVQNIFISAHLLFSLLNVLWAKIRLVLVLDASIVNPFRSLCTLAFNSFKLRWVFYKIQVLFEMIFSQKFEFIKNPSSHLKEFELTNIFSK